MKAIFVHLVVIWLGIYISFPVFASHDEREPNLRESCRERVAGLYLNTYDQMVQARERQDQMKSKIEISNKELKATASHILLLIKEAQKDEYDENKQHELASAREKEKSLQLALKDDRELLNSMDKNYAQVLEDEKHLKEKIVKVFEFRPFPSNSLGYPFKLEYKESCPKYKFSCPISKAAQTLLIAIFPPSSLPEVCKRYVR